MNYLILRFAGHPATFEGSAEMLKRWNPTLIVQRPVDGVVVVLGVERVEQLKGPMDEWKTDPKFAAELAQKMGLADDGDLTPSTFPER